MSLSYLKNWRLVLLSTVIGSAYDLFAELAVCKLDHIEVIDVINLYSSIARHKLFIFLQTCSSVNFARFTSEYYKTHAEIA